MKMCRLKEIYHNDKEGLLIVYIFYNNPENIIIKNVLKWNSDTFVNHIFILNHLVKYDKDNINGKQMVSENMKKYITWYKKKNPQSSYIEKMRSLTSVYLHHN